MIKVLELFAGIGACSKALERLGIPHVIVDAVEIDKYAIKSFNAIHGTNFEPQDIREWDKDIGVDLIMHGSPCQDFSVAGKNAGGDKGSGTRSSLMYETLRIVEKLRPKYVIWENVKNLLSNKHVHNWDSYNERMEELGYTTYCQILNAKDYGIPQNRERVFTISIKDYYDNTYKCTLAYDFKFPEKQELKLKLKDILESKVEDNYYLTESQTKNLIIKDRDISKTVRSGGRGSTDRHSWDVIRVGGLYDKGKTRHQAGSVYDPKGLCGTLDTMSGGNREPIIVASRGRGNNNEQHLELRKDNYVLIKTANKLGYDYCTNGDGIDLSFPDSKTKRGRVGHSVSKTITSNPIQGTMQEYRIRKLTPKECWCLMGFDDKDFEKAAKVCSNTQLYKQAGNSIVVNVLEGILTNLLQ